MSPILIIIFIGLSIYLESKKKKTEPAKSAGQKNKEKFNLEEFKKNVNDRIKDINEGLDQAETNREPEPDHKSLDLRTKELEKLERSLARRERELDYREEKVARRDREEAAVPKRAPRQDPREDFIRGLIFSELIARPKSLDRRN